MGILKRIRNIFSVRSSTPTAAPLSSKLLMEIFGRSSRTGALVNAKTADSVTTYQRAVQALSEAVGKLPFDVFEVAPNGDRTKTTTSPIYKLLNIAPNRHQTPIIFYSRLVTALMKKGNAYFLIKRDAQSRPIALIDINHINVFPFEFGDGDEKSIFYDVEGHETPFFSDDVFHVVGWGSHPFLGRNPIQVHAETLGISMATVETKGAVYGNLGNISGVLESDFSLTPEQKRKIVIDWKEQYALSKNAGKVAVLSDGFKFKPIQLSPADSQVLQAEEFQVDEIARMTGVPPHKLFKLTDSTLNNMEVMNAQFVEAVDTICVKIEQEARRKLLPKSQQMKFVIRANLYELKRGDMEARAEYWHKLTQDGIVLLNEARIAEGFKATPSGNVFYRPLNMMVVDENGVSVYSENQKDE